MENVAKALEIAGAILLALLIISLAILLFSNVNNFYKAQEDAETAKQLSKFNSEWEAYNKKLMYGTDVISLMNKVADNNRKAEGTTTMESSFVEIELTITSTFKTTGIIVTTNRDGTTEKTEATISELNQAAAAEGKTISHDALTLPKYTIVKDETGINPLTTFFAQPVNDIVGKPVRQTDGTIKQTYIYSGLTNFKTKVFQCESIIYDNAGRVSRIEISEQ